MGEKMISEREAVMRERAAADAGFRAGWSYGADLSHVVEGSHVAKKAARFAADAFPLPKVTRPRTKGDPHGQPMVYARIGNRIQQRATCGAAMRYGWQDLPPGMAWTAERLAIWAELAANPTEEVEQSDV